MAYSMSIARSKAKSIYRQAKALEDRIVSDMRCLEPLKIYRTRGIQKMHCARVAVLTGFDCSLTQDFHIWECQNTEQ